MFGLARRGDGRFPMFFLLSTYPFGVRDGKQDVINQSIRLARLYMAADERLRWRRSGASSCAV
jgi:hypothetical protein